MNLDRDVAENLRQVKEGIVNTAVSIGRNPASISLVAVSKAHPVERIYPVLKTGHCCFGENRVQEAEIKWQKLRISFSNLRLHLIGPLQTNKVKAAIGLFDVIETLDRPKLAQFLAREMEAMDKSVDCLIQVNTGEELQKTGILPHEADAFIKSCREIYQLPIKGLMCIPPVHEEPALHFALLSEIAKRNGLKELSMGMSTDYKTAILLGATSVRVGTAIFGLRS